MIYRNGKGIAQIFKGNRAISAIYKGARLVWQGVHSCFGGGYWDNNKGWNNNDGWNNG